MTAAACSPCTLSYDFLNSLALAETYSIHEGYLYLNLEANPNVEIEIGTEKASMKARALVLSRGKS